MSSAKSDILKYLVQNVTIRHLETEDGAQVMDLDPEAEIDYYKLSFMTYGGVSRYLLQLLLPPSIS